MRLSDNFTLEEFTFSPKAVELNIDNAPNEINITSMKFLCDNILEPARKYFNNPIKILSGFRCPVLNRALGGAPTSQHILGEAADIEVKNIKNDDVWQFIKLNLPFDQLIAEKLKEVDGNAGWVHVSYKRVGKQRNDAISFLGDGRYVSGLQYI